MKALSGLMAGLLFGIGLAASGMTNTEKVLGFLNIFGAWDSDLLFVMGFAVITASMGFVLVLRQKSPLFTDQFTLPTHKHLEPKLIIGALLFGIGWGLYGYCPGPAIAALVYLSPVTLIFVLSMIIGMWLITTTLNHHNKD
jgi:uncharacterized membrane protein YedE/YeeE